MALVIWIGWRLVRWRGDVRAATDATRTSWTLVYGGGVAVSVVVSTALMRGHVGGYANVLIPLFWLASAGLGLFVAQWRSARPGPVPIVGGAMLFVLQLGLQTGP